MSYLKKGRVLDDKEEICQHLQYVQKTIAKFIKDDLSKDPLFIMCIDDNGAIIVNCHDVELVVHIMVQWLKSLGITFDEEGGEDSKTIVVH